jgi:hypothetical protein
LDGFHYGRFGGKSNVPVVDRIKWLERQPPDDLRKHFKAQPFEHITKTYLEMGDTEAVSKIALLREKHLLRRPSQLPGWYEPSLQLASHWFRRLTFGVTLGYGYRPHRVLLAALLIWASWAFLYQEAARQGLFAPTDARIFMDKDMPGQCRVWTSTDCPLYNVKGYPVFNPWVFSLDVILPVVNLRQEDEWQPVRGNMSVPFWGTLPPDFLRWCMWFEILFGWAASLILVGMIGGLIKRGQNGG